MNLERLSVVLRQRNPWEAIDLGFALARRWWRPLFAAWLCVFVPVAVTAGLLLPPRWSMLVVWWLKPLLESVPLHVLAGAVFGSPPPLKDTLRGLVSYSRGGLGTLIPPLRFARWVRSFDLPIWQLEGARGSTFRSRARQLHRRVWSYAFALTLVCFLFETSVVLISLIGLYDLLTPAGGQDSFDLFTLLRGGSTGWQYEVVAAMYSTSVALIEPLYVAAGFALYLARRTQLEGWDLEVQLRRIAERDLARREAAASGMRGTAVAAVAGLLVALTLLIGSARPTLADEGVPEGQPASPHAPATMEDGAPARAAAPAIVYRRTSASAHIKDILSQPQFDEYEMQTVLEPRHKSPDVQHAGDLRGLSGFVQALSQILRVLVWCLLAVLLALALYWLLRRLDLIKREPKAHWTPPKTLFGLDVRPESLPEDVAAAALQLARSGDLTAALSLLYRGSLITLMHRDHVELGSGDTEADCLRKTRPQLPEPAHAYLQRLLSAWQGSAYAHRRLESREVEQLAHEWPGHFTMAQG